MPEIWIVEQEIATARAVAECLGEEGHRTRSLASPREAVALLERGAPDLLLVALPRPEAESADGTWALIERAPVPVLVLTPDATPAIEERLTALGVLAVLPKPFRFESLQRSIRQALAAEIADGRREAREGVR